MTRVDQVAIVKKQAERLRELADFIQEADYSPSVGHTLAPAIMECVRWLYQANANQCTYDVEDARKECENV